MMLPSIIPGRGFRPLQRQSSLLFHWESRDLSLSALSGQQGVFSRASVGTAIDPLGRVITVPAGQERWIWIGGVPYLLMEQARTNAWTWSEDFSNAVWGKTRSSITSNAAAAPDGTLTADKLVEDSTASDTHFLSRAVPVYTANVDQTYSVFVKAGERTRGRFYSTNVGLFGVQFDLSAGTISSVTSGGGTLTRSSITALGNGWYRISITGKVSASATSATVVLQLRDAAGNITYTGDGSSGIYAWGMQPEVDQPCPSSYIKTLGAAVTRVTDGLSFDYLPLPRAMTLYASFVERGTLNIMNGRVLQIGTGPRLYLIRSASGGGNYAVGHDNGVGLPQASTLSTPPAFGQRAELSATVDATGAVQISTSVESGPVVTAAKSAANAFGAAWTGNRLYVNSDATTDRGLIALESIKIASGVRTLDYMRAAF